jgi:hypothetical protein
MWKLSLPIPISSDQSQREIRPPMYFTTSKGSTPREGLQLNVSVIRLVAQVSFPLITPINTINQLHCLVIAPRFVVPNHPVPQHSILQIPTFKGRNSVKKLCSPDTNKVMKPNVLSVIMDESNTKVT